uniref:Putative secreted protein n=1 Tax=Ixodes ricinus TaxID=34613 RepID=A0A6B0U0H2_IXORI
MRQCGQCEALLCLTLCSSFHSSCVATGSVVKPLVEVPGCCLNRFFAVHIKSCSLDSTSNESSSSEAFEQSASSDFSLIWVPCKT